MKEPYVVFLGDVAQDEYYEVERWPGRAEKVLMRTLPPQMGGMIANAASVYASYGAKTRFSGVLNPRDKKLCDQLEACGIDTGLVMYDPALADSKCMIFLSQGEHTVFINDMKVEAAAITPAVQQAYCGAAMIYSGFWALRTLRLGAQTPVDIVRAWHENGVRLMIDSDVDKLTEEDKAFLPYVHTLFMNEVGFESQRDGAHPGPDGGASAGLRPHAPHRDAGREGVCRLHKAGRDAHSGRARAGGGRHAPGRRLSARSPFSTGSRATPGARRALQHTHPRAQ